MRYPQDVPTLSDGVVTLRAHGEGDVPALLEQGLDPAMVRWTTVPVPASEDSSRTFAARIVPRGWETGEAWAFAVEATGEDGLPRFCGTVELRDRQEGRAEIAYGAHPWARGRGVMERACRLLFQGKPYYATHPDKTCITRTGLVPDIAAIIAACEAVTGRRPRIVGKPAPEIVRAALRRLGARAETTAMIGDQLDTDMTMARASDLCSILVMSGETTPAKLEAWPADARPMLIARDAGEVAAWLR